LIDGSSVSLQQYQNAVDQDTVSLSPT
jgi:hypothetical protein